MGLRVLNQGAEGPRRWEGGWYQGHPGSPGRSLSQGLEARAPVTPPPQPGPSARDLAPLRQDSAPPLCGRVPGDPCCCGAGCRRLLVAVQGRCRGGKPSRQPASPPAPAGVQRPLPSAWMEPPPGQCLLWPRWSFLPSGCLRLPPQDAGPRTHCTPLPGALLELGAVFNQKSVSRAKRLDICLHTG